MFEFLFHISILRFVLLQSIESFELFFYKTLVYRVSPPESDLETFKKHVVMLNIRLVMMPHVYFSSTDGSDVIQQRC